MFRKVDGTFVCIYSTALQGTDYLRNGDVGAQDKQVFFLWWELLDKGQEKI